VWKAWTDPEHIVKWWGPHGFTTTTEEMNVKPGGVWRYVMHGPDGVDYPNKIVYEELVEPERIVFSHSGAKKGGPNALFQGIVTFVARGAKTEVTMRQLFRTTAERDQVVKTYGAIEGGKQTFERMAEHVAKMASSH
jgi:uncharacterized protein YndB with AHSA1/START domain